MLSRRGVSRMWPAGWLLYRQRGSELKLGRPSTARGGRRMRLLTAVVGVLLALFGTFAAVTGLAVPAPASEDRAPAGSDPQRVESATSAAQSTTGKAQDRRLRCQPGQTPPEYLHTQRTQGLPKHDPATLRKGSVDQLEWVQPGVCPLPVPSALPADISRASRAAVQRRAHRTFDGRAPPATSRT